ncbi:S-adenosylmethionine:tRNA ribosyltransferase-isomerase [Polluticoccus soli]|uniref:S-adenosylmethionine:tRNA ribosyltransferase-isomerase n=1 Tax=Polluticoccus soli TaxID=3034150 RepID=UPI0023E0A9EC|nr:S-adenosylmethionine:tRNA ribosyltransferase-isomerase [Flavipsychrobacter sp. JY13-12]
MHPSQLRIEDFTYNLPDEKVAQYPLAERDSSKLLVYKSGQISDSSYSKLPDHLPSNALLVFNQTKVIHARLLFKKETGGVIEVFCLEPHQQYADVQTAMLQSGKVWWKCMIGGASKWKYGMVLSIHHNGPDFTLSATIVEREQSTFTLELTWDSELTFAEVLHHVGKVPLPPYLHREAEQGDESTYQTVYAKVEGSVAAPTAGLHFTEQLLNRLSEKGITKEYVTLHVGAGTFKPVKSETMKEHEMHAEWIDVSIETLQNLISNLGKHVVAVGTTSMRTLESLYWIGAKLLQGLTPDFAEIAVHQWDPYELTADIPTEKALRAVIDYLLLAKQSKLVTRTQILIAPGYTPRVVKGLITNFHQPQSTLLLLVAALIGNDWRKVYDHALANDYRFLSYGDGCLLMP